jgi:hypothetical protein
MPSVSYALEGAVGDSRISNAFTSNLTGLSHLPIKRS